MTTPHPEQPAEGPDEAENIEPPEEAPAEEGAATQSLPGIS
ncbi:MAG: hypothetical protein QOJ72_1004 [Nocardioidaceae bacterium]|jgi:hypothetical protein|nr:hypothetical protein [Nocardioidaceae bacterium]